MRKYLIIAPSWVGDMVMSQSLYRYLKSLHPDCLIDIAAPKHCCVLAQFMPEINQSIPLEFTHGQFSLFSRINIGKKLRANNYTHAIVLPNSWKSALIPFAAKIKRRIGWHGEERYFLLNDKRRLDKTKYPIMIERLCALAIDRRHPLQSPLPKPRFIPNPNQSSTTLDEFQIQVNNKLIALCPGAEFGPAKKWPTSYYAQVAQYLLDKGHTVLLLGSSKDKESTYEIQHLYHKHPLLHNLAGQTDLYQAIHLLSSCNQVISNDSGLMHIACALNIPTLVIYGSTSDQFTPPLNHQAKSIYLKNLACRPCFKRQCPLGHMDCMNKLTPQTIIDALEQL